jgi:hypothetical protein
MTIYIDELTYYPDHAIKPGIRHLGNHWCHMACDGNLNELHAFARQLGLRAGWFQDHRLVPHYDLTPEKRILAVQFGAREISSGDLVRSLKRGQIHYRHGV